MFRAYFVDDEPLVLRDIINNPLFADYGYQTVGSSSMPLKAIAEIKKLNPDVVFTDLQMPECSGVDLIEKLRENGSDCEFVVISGYREFDESIRFFRLGGLDYILKPLKDEDLQQLLDKLTAKLAVKKSDESKQVDTSSSVLNEIIAYMKANIADKITLESISEAHHMTVPSICRLFSGQHGTTFLACLTKLRMEEAARLLRETKKDVKEITRLCGYDDYFYFCRVFRKHHLCAPTAFREGAK